MTAIFMDYSLTVNLPKTDFPMKADLPKREPGMLAQWHADRVYETLIEKRRPEKGKKQFILHDGPPYANGHLHLGHALNKILKDIIVRLKAMTGHYAPYVPGWDCHGLPIELQLMKELKVTDKHKVDREKFRDQAKAFAEKFVALQREEFQRMGILGDWDHPYLTMSPEYKKRIVDLFQELEKKGYVYRGLKPVYWCATDETALAEAEVEYENDAGPSIFVAFPSVAQADLSFVIWTTTPWTLPANVAIARLRGGTYVVFQVESGRRFVLAEARLEEFQKATGLKGRVVPDAEIPFAQGARHPWIKDRIAKILDAEFVAMDTGTGLVHIAPGHGREDYVLGMQQNPPLPVLSPVDDRGLFTDQVPEWKGQHVFKANALIIEFLRQQGSLLHAEEITHSYPHCWRCHRPVIFRATEQWFLNVDHERLRERLLKAIGEVKWIPAYGENRITGMVQMRPDWCLSRQRLWGTEIPKPAPGSGLEAQGSVQSPQPAAQSKDPDIFDVWFESGVSWSAVLEQRPDLSYPADLYLEGSDQHRGWFQTSLIPSVALRQQAPYKAVLTHGFVMDGEGRPMSKSLGNVIAPQEIMKQYGADVLRLWVGSSDYGGDVRLSPEILKGQAENYRKIRNTLRYFLGNLADFNPQKDAVAIGALHKPVDQWALHVLQRKIRDARKAYDQYEFQRVTSSIVDFCVRELSGIYLDIVKDRLYCDAPDSPSRRSVQTVLYHMADALVRLLAPIMPFTADEAWHQLGHAENIALASLPDPLPQAIDDGLGADWPYVWDLREEIYQEIEAKRKAGEIGSSLEAWVTVSSQTPDFLRLITKVQADLPMLFLVARVDIRTEETHKVIVKHAREAGFQKCARCWTWRGDVGAEKRWPDVCARCAGALNERPEQVAR